ncbi:hypothetical protein BVRB_4g070890 [Beta vulgaris subsp. vulgaris]|nr:hypothetical protein BVRB_4g070890 [Beta vulgaris subsp. vulgaris]
MIEVLYYLLAQRTHMLSLARSALYAQRETQTGVVLIKLIGIRVGSDLNLE